MRASAHLSLRPEQGASAASTAAFPTRRPLSSECASHPRHLVATLERFSPEKGPSRTKARATKWGQDQGWREERGAGEAE